MSIIPDLEKLKLPDFIKIFLEGIFGKTFSDWLIGAINSSKGVYSFDELVKRHPVIKDQAIRNARVMLSGTTGEEAKPSEKTAGLAKPSGKTEGVAKLSENTVGLDYYKEGYANNTFTSFKKGLGMVKPLMEIVGTAAFAPDYLVRAVFKTFEAAVASPGALVYHYHNGEQTLIECLAKDLKNGEIEIAYIYLNVKAEKKRGVIRDSSNATIKYNVKVIKFSDAESLVRWTES